MVVNLCGIEMSELCGCYQVCQMFNDGAQQHWIQEQQVPYMVKGDQWIGYESEDSLRLKVRLRSQQPRV